MNYEMTRLAEKLVSNYLNNGAMIMSEQTKNPIFIEYYSHDKCDCYKINLPWSTYHTEKLVLCKVSEGIEYARQLAIGVLTGHMYKALRETEPKFW